MRNPFFRLTPSYEESLKFQDYVSGIDKNDWTNLKFYVWGRKICDVVEQMKDFNESDRFITEYLSFCMDIRSEFIDDIELTDTERFYTIGELHEKCLDYNVHDPLYDSDLI